MALVPTYRNLCRLLLVLAVLATTTSGFAKRSAATKRKKPAASPAKGFGASKVAAPKPSAAASSHACEANPKWEAFVAWLEASGASIDAIELAEFRGGLRGVRATRALKQGDTLMKIPRKAILDVDAADASAVGALWHDADPPLPGYAKLALAVLHETRRGDASAYAPYLALLPSVDEFAADGGPAAMWSDDELRATECAKLIEDATRLRSRRAGDGHAVLQADALAVRWAELELPGSPPTSDEFAWAVTAVTSRAYTLQGGVDGASQVKSGLIPMVDMANHDGVLPPKTAKGLEEAGDYFSVLAAAPFRKGEQVFLSYGPLPNFRLLQQWGFVLDALASPPDVGLANLTPLLDARADGEGDGSTSAALGAGLARAAEEGRLMREADGAISTWQPAGPPLEDAIIAAALHEVGGGSSVAGGAADADAEAAAVARGKALYREVLQATLDGFSTSAAVDGNALDASGDDAPAPRMRLALQFRRSQKVLLNRALAASARGAPKKR